MKTFRKEKDFLGEVLIPKNAYYGINSFRASQNFPISSTKNHKELVKAIAKVKLSAFKLFRDNKIFEPKICDAVIKAATELYNGLFDEHLIVDVFQAGAGTSLHMNINEIIANRANELLGNPLGSYKPVHPNDTVNYAQSTNDVIPTAMRIAVISVSKNLFIAIKELSESFLKKGKQFKNLIKSGRTHLCDATPITLGDEFSAYGLTLKKEASLIKKATKAFYEVGISGTATGSGINAPVVYKKNIIKYLQKETSIGLRLNPSLFEAMQNQGDFAHFMGSLKSFALNMIRISNDLRLLSSGPNTGLNEITLPKVQAGSSIMPGKVNPSIPEMLTMVCFYVCGMEETVAMAVQAGQLELNVMMPIIAHATLSSVEYLTNAVKVMNEKCIKGIEAKEEKLKEYAFKSLGLATILNPVFGYEKVAELVNQAREQNKTIIQLIKEKRLLAEKELTALINKAIKG